MFYRAVTAGGFKTNLGLVFVIVKVQLVATDDKESETDTNIVYNPTSTNPIECATIVSGLRKVNIPPGIDLAFPPFNQQEAVIESGSKSSSMKKAESGIEI